MWKTVENLVTHSVTPTSHRISALDGLRAVAILAVLALHTSYGHVPGGWIGVDLFFALSGYLITTLLCDELDATGTVRLRAFYLRRARRLYPALLAAVLLAGVLWRWQALDAGAVWPYSRAVLPVVGYVANYFMASLGSLSATWSLAIEEQFYLVWPAVLLLIATRFVAWRRLALGVVILAILAVMWHRAGADVRPERYLALYAETPYRADTILCGVLAALVLRSARVRSWCAQLGDGARLASCGLLLAAFAGLTLTMSYAGAVQALVRGGFTALALGCALLVVLVATAPSVSLVTRLLGASPLVWLGLRSYGVYLYHKPIDDALEQFLIPGNHVALAAVTALRIVLPLGVAALSYRYLEEPIRRGRRATAVLSPRVSDVLP